MSAEERVAEIPFFVHEADMARLERTNKRMFILESEKNMIRNWKNQLKNA